MRAALGRRDLHFSEKVVLRLMKQECLIVTANRRRRYGSYLGEISPAPENIINRNFHAETPNEKWPGWLKRVHEAKLIRSMSRKGCSPDNAACEGFFGRLKTELFYPRNWQDVSIDQFIETVDSYIRWYNEKRIKISLGSLSPIEYRASL